MVSAHGLPLVAHQPGWATWAKAEEAHLPCPSFPTASSRRRLRRKLAAKRRPAEPAQASLSCGDVPLAATDEGSAALIAALEAGGQGRVLALAHVRGNMVPLAFDRHGCRVVQSALQAVDHAAAVMLIAELHGHVRDAAASPHANYVIQAVITELPTAMSEFVAQELIGVGAKTARHRFGCRIICRLIEHCGLSAEVEALLQEITSQVEDLSLHTFGHFVAESLLEHLPEYRRSVASVLARGLPQLACHRYAGHVVEAALTHCSNGEGREELVDALLGADVLAALVQHQFGHFALRALLRVPGPACETAKRRLLQASAGDGGSKKCLQLLQAT